MLLSAGFDMTTSPWEAAALAAWAYPAAWLASPLLDRDLLAQQFRRRQQGDDSPTEHARYAMFQLHLAPGRTFTDETISELLMLIELDPDAGMASAVFDGLLRHAGLTDAQFAFIGAHPRAQTSAIQRTCEREAIQRKLRANPAPREAIEAVFARRDSQLERALLDLQLDELTDHELEQLAAEGHGRAVRNQARQRLAQRQAAQKRATQKRDAL